MRHFFLTAAILLALIGLTAAGDWPNWLGPKHDGISEETGWSVEWPEAGLPVVWEKEIGIGFSSVSIVDEKLFTMGHVDGEEFVYCLNATTGEVVWSYKYPCQLLPHLHEGGPCSTPTVDGEFVYTLGKEGQLFCFNKKTGEVVWKQELQTDLGVTTPEWAFSSSAYILGDQLLLEAGRVVSYNKLTGAKNWQTELHQAGYGSVAPFEVDGETLLATLDCDGLRITDAKDGTELAFTAWDSPFRTNSTTPIVVGNKIYVSSGYNKGCGLFEYHAGELREIYTSRNMRNHFNNSILHNGFLYGMDGNSNLGRVVQLTCMNFETGEVMWQHAGYGCGSLMIANGHLLILSDKGELAVAKASPKEFKEIANSPCLTGRCWTIPVLLDGKIYARNAAGTLKCVNLK